MVCVLNDGHSCRYPPLTPKPAHNTSPIYPLDGTYLGSHHICLPAPQHIPDPPRSRERKLQSSKHQCLWRHNDHDKPWWRRNSFPMYCFRRNPSPGEISFNLADDGSSPKDLGWLRKKKQTAPPCGTSLSTVTCCFCWRPGGVGSKEWSLRNKPLKIHTNTSMSRWKAKHSFLPPFPP